jgi:hypothetical protein
LIRKATAGFPVGIDFAAGTNNLCGGGIYADTRQIGAERRSRGIGRHSGDGLREQLEVIDVVFGCGERQLEHQ